MWPARSSVSSHVRAAISVARPCAWRQSQRRQSASLRRVRPHAGCSASRLADQTEIRAAHLAPLQNHDACHGSQSTANTPAESSETLFCCVRGGEATLLSTVAPWWGYLSSYQYSMAGWCRPAGRPRRGAHTSIRPIVCRRCGWRARRDWGDDDLRAAPARRSPEGGGGCRITPALPGSS